MSADTSSRSATRFPDQMRSWFSGAEWLDGPTVRHGRLEAWEGPTGKLFERFDRCHHRTAQAVPGNHRAPSGDTGAARRGRRGDGRTEGRAHGYPRHGKGAKAKGAGSTVRPTQAGHLITGR